MTVQIPDSAEISQMLPYSFNSNSRFLGINRIGRSSRLKSMLHLLWVSRKKEKNWN